MVYPADHAELLNVRAAMNTSLTIVAITTLCHSLGLTSLATNTTGELSEQPPAGLQLHATYPYVPVLSNSRHYHAALAPAMRTTCGRILEI
jgi:hypothetical protein